MSDTSYVLYCCVLFHVFLSGDTGIRLSYRAQDGYTGADTIVRLLCSCLVLRLPRRRWYQIHVAGPRTRVARLGAAPAMHERLPHTCKIPPTRAVTNQTNAQLDLTAVADALPTIGLAWPKCAKHKRVNPAAIMKDARRVLNDMPPWVRASRDADQDILLVLLDRYRLQALRAPVQCALARVLSEGVAPIT